jgi:hypothetical protein
VYGPRVLPDGAPNGSRQNLVRSNVLCLVFLVTRFCSSASVREQYAQITAKLASDLLGQLRTSNGTAFESKPAPPTLIPPSATKKRDAGVQTELESTPLSKRGSSAETPVEDASSSANLQNVIEQLQGQLALYEVELTRAHSVARALEANLHQRDVHVRTLEADCEKLRAEKARIPFWFTVVAVSLICALPHRICIFGRSSIWKSVMVQTCKPSRMQAPRSNGCERRCATFINHPVGCTKVSKMRWKGRPRAFVSFALEPPSQVLIPFRPLAPLLPEILGVTIHEQTTISDVHTETTTMPPPPPPDAHIPSSSQPTSQRPNHPATFAVTIKTSSQNTITIPKSRFPPGPSSAPPVVSASNLKFASPTDDSHPPQHQRQAHHVPKRNSTVPVPTNRAHSQGHIMNYFQATAHHVPHQLSVNHTPPIPIVQQLPSQPQVTNRSVSSANPTPRPAEGQRQPIAIAIQCGNPIADSIFSGTSD